MRVLICAAVVVVVLSLQRVFGGDYFFLWFCHLESDRVLCCCRVSAG